MVGKRVGAEPQRRQARTTFAPEAFSVPAARAWSQPLLHAWGVEGSATDALIVVSELVTNAVAHGRGPVQLLLRRTPSAIRVEVTDAGGGAVEVASPEPDATRGRGLMIVERFSRAWGVDRHDEGKTVWAELAAVEDRGPNR